PEDAASLGLAEGAIARITSRRGSITAPVHVDGALREGLAFMTLHFPDQVETNILTLDTWDPKSGTAEFKATAIRVEQATPEEAAAARERMAPTEVVT
ncbi:MAG TPA: molybdopterin dinucleotide binding domain-containing protein, partial [Lentzea sp.]